MINIIVYLIFITLLFLLYVELNIGNVIYRITDTGKKEFNIFHGLSYLIEPLRNKILWDWRLLDINYLFILIISIIIYKNNLY